MRLFRADCDCGESATRRTERGAWSWFASHTCVREDAANLTPADRLAAYRPFARKTANYMCRGHKVDYEEAYADALIGLWQAAERWDPARGVKFGTFASRRMRGAILDGIRERGQNSRSACRTSTGVDFISLDQPVNDEDDRTVADLFVIPSGEDEVILRLDMTAAVRHELDRLSARDRRMVTDHLAGRTLAAVAGDVGLSECRASQILTKWRAEVNARYERRSA